MGLIALCLIIWILFILKEGWDFGQIGLFIIICIVGLIVQFIGYQFKVEHTYKDIPLHIESAFSEKNWKISGGFIVGLAGGSNSEYVVYGKFSRGLKRVNLNVNKVYIIESTETPKIKNFWIKTTKKPHDDWFFVSWSERITTRKNYSNLILVVPKKTVYKQFELK